MATQYLPLSKQSIIGTLFSGGSNYNLTLQNATAFTLSSFAPSQMPSNEAQVLEDWLTSKYNSSYI